MLYELRDVTVEFSINKNSVKILSDFSMTIEEGEFLVLIGPSGIGKTTILNLLAGFLTPTKGSVLYKGKDLKSFNSQEKAKYRNLRIGMVHQFFNLIPNFTALQNVMIPSLISGDSWNMAKQKAEEMLERVGMLIRAHHLPTELSGGEQQRIAIARALVNKPDVVLADEPTGNLDIATSKEIVELMSEFHKDGTSFVVVTHDPDVAKYATRVIDLKEYMQNS